MALYVIDTVENMQNIKQKTCNNSFRIFIYKVLGHQFTNQNDQDMRWEDLKVLHFNYKFFSVCLTNIK